MINHIRASNAENESWCGQPLGVEFYFKDAEAAALNGLYESRLVVCEHCALAITVSLNKSIENNVSTSY